MVTIIHPVTDIQPKKFLNDLSLYTAFLSSIHMKSIGFLYIRPTFQTTSLSSTMWNQIRRSHLNNSKTWRLEYNPQLHCSVDSWVNPRNLVEGFFVWFFYELLFKRVVPHTSYSYIYFLLNQIYLPLLHFILLNSAHYYSFPPVI